MSVIIVANRLPVQREGAEWATSPGGLVSSLSPLLRERRGTWVGWSGVPDDAPPPFEHEGIRNVAVALDPDEVDEYYLGFCNACIWPLFHDALRTPEFHRGWWQRYQEVNRRFAAAAAEVARPGDFVWVQDYHLQLVPRMLRDMVRGLRIGFYLHIPFPPVEIFARLPWRRRILEGVAAADLVGFQTGRARRNFHAAAAVLADAEVSDGVVKVGDRACHTVTAPISIDVAGFEGLSRSSETARRAEQIRADLGDPGRLVLGVDRLDYTKGIDVRLRAFGALLDREPERSADTVFVQVASPSRETLGDYEEMRRRIEELVGRVNGVHGEALRTPVHYFYGNVGRDELVSYYAAADVMCVTPLRDGMNLVAKEFVVSRPLDDGVLVLSEFAGVADELEEALLVNPYDVDGMAATLRRALDLPLGEQRRRIRAMKRRVRADDVHHWSAGFIDAMP